MPHLSEHFGEGQKCSDKCGLTVLDISLTRGSSIGACASLGTMPDKFTIDYSTSLVTTATGMLPAK